MMFPSYSPVAVLMAYWPLIQAGNRRNRQRRMHLPLAAKPGEPGKTGELLELCLMHTFCGYRCAACSWPF